ncbi:class C beta-lactamase-related serine hydrolase [Palleronia sediminis]|uniref:Class C beta-lactamase-related serine hydrolase n=1 Tax=Palleronia sediminis TaxID=2547833 RepID=A0A4R6AFJ6_9RHOB|nr:serine hydrolase [Palleronia sediminis]TDL81198.1 class C beta-lactamase-related serine hydrolase [Palleronia sediminis]
MHARRRVILAGGAALAMPAILPFRAFGQSSGLDDIAARAGGLDQLHALVIRRNGATLFERAYAGPGLDAPANVKSVSKTLLALLTGIAIDRGALPGTEARVLPLLGRSPAGDARDAITVGDLLSMRAGLASTSGADYGAWVASADWVEHALTRELVAEPGGRYIYSTGGWHVLGAVLAKATGRDLLDLARDWLGRPLGIAIPPWERDPQGRYMGGNQMALTPRALARVGEMVVNGGRWDGTQVVPADWIERSWESRGRSRWTGDGYGYGWFLTSFAGRRAAYGRGYGGQVLAVVPDLDLAIAITSDPLRPARSQGYFGDLQALMDAVVATA